MRKTGKLRRWVLGLVIAQHNKSEDSLLASSGIYCHVNKQVDGYHVARGRESGSIVTSHVAVPSTPKGHVAVYVGEEAERFLVPIAYLSHPHLQGLLKMSASEFGYEHAAGLRIPCAPSFFLHKLSLIHRERSPHASCMPFPKSPSPRPFVH